MTWFKEEQSLITKRVLVQLVYFQKKKKNLKQRFTFIYWIVVIEKRTQSLNTHLSYWFKDPP